MSDTIRVAIHGAAGRMGRRLVALATADERLTLAAALEAADCPLLGQDAGEAAGCGKTGVVLSDSLAEPVDVLVDFSTAAATDRVLDLCGQSQIPLVLATTGLSDRQRRALQELAGTIPIVAAPNMSLAVNLGMRLVETAAQGLTQHDADVEILERHHRFKEDAPSGTALRFGELIAGVMGQTEFRHGREGRPGKRPHNEIGYHAIRVGDNPGEHTIVFGMLGETLEVTVRATSRDAYAQGALAAAKFIVTRPPGLYSMFDVLGF